MTVKFARRVDRSPDSSPKHPINIHMRKLREMNPRHSALKHAFDNKVLPRDSAHKLETLRSEATSALGFTLV